MQRPRRPGPVTVLIALAGLASALPPDRALAAPGEGGRRLTVTSYNIHHGVGVDEELDLTEVADVLELTGADVIGLQEVDNAFGARSDFEDQAAILAALLDMDFAYGANLDLEPLEPGGARRQYGTAILSRYPIASSQNTLLPTLGGEQRGLLEAEIAVRGVRLRVFDTHLQHDNAEERTLQARAIAQRIDAVEEPVVLLGDLNALPSDAELAPLMVRLDDAAALAGGGAPTYPAESPDRRIDYVLLGRCLRVKKSVVTPTLASDHLPVSATLLLPGRSAGGRSADCPNKALARAHAHNDYEHERPLVEALANGFASVEADIWLVAGQLLVAHDEVDLDPERTLEALYLEPLAERVQQNGGRVYARWRHSLQLLIDIKTEAEPTYLALHDVLARYGFLFSEFEGGGVEERAVTAVISGNRPRALMAAQPLRFAAYDGRLSDLGGVEPASFIPLISDNWNNHFSWVGTGPMSDAERSTLQEMVATAHDNGQRVRFWATPEEPTAREALWQELLAAGVDYVNTDHLPELRLWLTMSDPQAAVPPVDWFD